MGLWNIIVPNPANDRNECLEPSFEMPIVNWATGGTNTLARSTEQQYRGAYSAKITYSNSTTLLSLAQTFVNKTTTYYLKAKVYVPSNWDGGILALSTSGYTGATTTTVTDWTRNTDPYGAWFTLKTTLAVAADEAGTITLTSSGSTPTATRYIYVDALYFGVYDSEYFDGDERLGWWEGNRHYSISQMDYRNRQHGVLSNLDNYNVYLGHPQGFDFPTFDNETRARAVGTGSEFIRTNSPGRAGQLPVTVKGTSENNYHSVLKAFQNLVKPNQVPGNHPPYTLAYSGANADVLNYIDARLAKDLTLKRVGFSGLGAWQMLATSPAWYERQDRYAALTRSQSLSVAYLLGWLNESGFDDMGNSGTGQVRAQAIDVNNDLLVGGQFLNFAGNADADNIARYVRATDTWTSLFAGGANSNVNDILVLDDGRMVIVGAFTNIGGTSANRVAIWDGSTITALGSGFNGECYTVRYDYNNNYLYFGGTFTTANGVTVNRIAQYDLVAGTFGDLDSGANSDVRSIYITTNGNLLVGGDFTSIGDPGVTAYYMAYYNLSTDTWSKLTTGTSGANTGTNGAVYSITLGDNNKIYIGGNFTQVAGRDANNVAWRYFSEPSWHPMGQGLTGGLGIPVEYMVWDEVLQKLLISGRFTTAGINTVDRVVLWNGTSFERVGLDFPGDAAVYSFVRNPRNGDYFYAFDTSGTIIVPSATTTLTNNGTDDTYPVFYFVGGGSTGSAYANLLFITNLTTGARLAFEKLTINDGSTVVIDLTPGRVKVYRIIGQTLYDLTVGAFSRESDIAAFTLRPGVNMLTVAAANVNGSPTITAYALWRNRHHSLSGTAA